ncbi:MAG: phosphate/phosphite/phosphonate ABC transporter substrate-binding protein [Asticcacaulis sp.]
MTRSGFICKVIATFTLVSALIGCQQAKPPHADEVSFSVTLPETATEARSAWQAFLDDMASQTGLKIRTHFTIDDAASVKAMGDNHVQAGLFSNPAALQAVRDANAYVIARASDPNAPEGYRSLILTRADSGLSLEHLMACSGGLRLGMGEEHSLAGSLAPLTYLFLPENIAPDKCFASIDRSDPATQTEALMAGRLDATVSNTIALQRLTTTKPDASAGLKVVWTSPLLPDPPLLLRKDLDPATREKLRSFILSYGTGDSPEAERQRGVLARLGLAAFQPADDTHLLPMREMEAARILIETRKENNPAAIAKAEKDFERIASERRALAKPLEAPADPS